MANKAGVFISYSRRDNHFAFHLRDAFEQAGRKAWLDEKDILPTEEWQKKIVEAIDASDAVVFVLSQDFIASAECAKEIELAADRNKRLVPIVAAPIDPHLAPAALAARQWISFAGGADFDAQFAILSQALDTDLEYLVEHTRLHVRAVDWEARGRDSSLVLRGRDLTSAERLVEHGGGKEPPPSLLQTQFVAAGRRSATRRQRLVAGALLTGLIVAVALAIFAFIQRNAAREARDQALRRLYTLQLTRVQDLANSDPGRALEVLDSTLRSAGGLREFTWDLYWRLCNRTVLALGGMQNYTGEASQEASPVVALSPDGLQLATASVRRAKRWEHSRNRLVGEILLWNLATGARTAALTFGEGRYWHHLTVRAIAFSPDGRRVAASAGSMPTVVKVWDLGTGTEVYCVNTDEVVFLAFAASESEGVRSDRLLGLSRSAVQVWDRIVPEVAPRRFATPYQAALSVPANGAFFTANPREIVRWDIASGRRQVGSNPAGAQGQVALAPNAERIAIINVDTISVWRSQPPGNEPKLEWTLKGESAESFRSIAFSAEGRVLASGGSDNTVRLWDLERGISTLALRGPQREVTALSFSSDGRRLAAGAADATVFVWDIAVPPESPIDRIPIARNPLCFAVSTESSAVVVVADGKVEIRTPMGGQQLPALGRSNPRHCGISARGTMVFTVGEDFQLSVWDVGKQRLHASIGRVSDPRSVRISSKGETIAAFVAPDRIGIWNASSGTSAGTIQTGGELVEPFEFMDEKHLAGRVRDKDAFRVSLWNLETRRSLVSVSVDAKTPDVFAACPDRRFIASAAGEKFHVIDLARSKVLPAVAWYPHGLFSPIRKATELAFSPGCMQLALGDDFGQISLWDVATGNRFATMDAHPGLIVTDDSGPRVIAGVTTKRISDGVTAMAYSPDGKTIASGGGIAERARGELKLWSASGGELLAQPAMASGPVTSIRFSSDGTRLVALLEPSTQDPDLPPKSVDVWSSRWSPELASVLAHESPVTSLKFSPKGTQLFTTAARGTAKLWDVAADHIMQPLEDWYKSGVASWMRETGANNSRIARSADGKVRIEAHSSYLYLFRGPEAAPQVLKSEDNERFFHSQEIRWIRMLSDGSLISLAGDGGGIGQPIEIVRWDLSAGKPAQENFEPATVVNSLVISPDERMFVTVGAVGSAVRNPGLVHVWDMHEFRHVASLVGHRSGVTAAAFSPDGMRLSTGDVDGYVRIWDLTAIQRLSRPTQ